MLDQLIMSMIIIQFIVFMGRFTTVFYNKKIYQN